MLLVAFLVPPVVEIDAEIMVTWMLVQQDNDQILPLNVRCWRVQIFPYVFLRTTSSS